MANFYIFLAALAMVHCGSLATDSQCSSNIRSVGLSVRSAKNESGKWTCLLSTSTTEDSITMDVMQNITECDGRRVIRIQGSFGKADEPAKGMVFHSKFGSNVLISNNGRTIVKKNINLNGNGTAFTSRPLEYDELLEVSLDKRGSEWSFSIGIGVMTVRPEDFEIPYYAYYSPHIWMYLSNSILNNGTIKRSDYGVNLDKLPAGTRFGVMRKSSGDLHFFVNGIDQGSALSGISGPIYGVANLRRNAEKITILNP